MQALHLQVSEFLRAQGVRRDGEILLAVSGGGDSVAMLHVMASLGQQVGVVHVHHGLRGDAADRDAAFVREQAQRLGVPFYLAFVDASTPDGDSPEARARRLRYAALEELRRMHRYRYIATAHTVDDQAETVLLRMLRGTGPRGLAGIQPRLERAHCLRPLLEVTRADIDAYLEACRVEWVEDESNSDPRFTRNRLRHEVLPLLETIHPQATRRLAALANHAGELSAWMAIQVDALLDAATQFGDEGVWLDGSRWNQAPAALRHWALGEVLDRLGLGEQVSRVHIERISAFLLERERPRLSLPRDSVMVRRGRHYWLGPNPGPSQTKVEFQTRRLSLVKEERRDPGVS